MGAMLKVRLDNAEFDKWVDIENLPDSSCDFSWWYKGLFFGNTATLFRYIRGTWVCIDKVYAR